MMLFSQASIAETLEISFDIPEVETGQYRRPYVAIWLEEKTNWKSNQSLILWYDDNEWLKDIRRWWRKVGRYNKEVDAFSGATKAAGHYEIKHDVDLEAGKQYVLYVEAVREHGNRSLLKTLIDTNNLPNEINLKAGHEIGPVTIKIKDAS